MSLPLFYLKNLYLSFGQDTIFTDISAYVNAGDKICLIGKNGSGKSTLLKLMAKIIEPDKGEIYYKPNLKIGFLTQQPFVNQDITINEYVLQNIELIGDESIESKTYLADIILHNLKLDGETKLSKLSGGKLRRADLARVLVTEPDLLFLDEPTNHLDIESIEWLEQYLQKFSGGIVVVSHDRAFLRNVSNKTIWIDRKNLLTNNKGYVDFDRWSEEVYNKEEKELSKLGKEVDKENLWLQQGVTARRKRNQQRLQNLLSLRDKLKQDKSRFKNLDQTIKLDKLNSNNNAKLVAELNDVSFSYNDVSPPKLMLNKFSLTISKGEIIGVMGKNGAGKTTLIKLLTGKEKPSSGIIKFGANLEYGYLDQARSLDQEKTLWETLCPNGGDTIFVNNTPKHVVAYLKDFLFDGNQAKAKVSTLSGGQQNRLLLAKMLINPGNFLILDEPTNDLDMDTLDMLVEILSEYKGSLLIVSHDRDFLERLVTRTIIIDNHTITDFHGGYYDYIFTTKQKEVPAKSISNIQHKNKVKESNKLSYKDERELSLLPEQIDKLSKEISTLEVELNEPDLYNKDRQKFEEITINIQSFRSKLEQLENRWIELEELKSRSK